MKYGTGDSGWTSLFGGERVLKFDTRLELVGTLDEATSFIGLARSRLGEIEARTLLAVQEALYLLMAEVASDEQARSKFGFQIGEAQLKELEANLEALLEKVKLPNKFVAPGECFESALLDVARTIVRRAERLAVLAREQGALGNPTFLSYLNRLSTLLYVMARYEEAKRGKGYAILRHAGGRATKESRPPSHSTEETP